MSSGEPPSPGGRPQANGLRLFVRGPDEGDFPQLSDIDSYITALEDDENFSQLNDVDSNITARELAKAFIETRYGILYTGPLVVLHHRDSSVIKLVPRRTLAENGVTDGGRIIVLPGRTLSGGPFELVATFVAGAVASGVLGNASYDLLKDVMGGLRKRFGSTKDAGLSEQDVVDIAVGCCCVRLKIEDLNRVIADDAWIDPRSIGIYPPLVPDRIIGNVILSTPRGPVFALIMPAADGDPEGLQIELKFPLHSHLH